MGSHIPGTDIYGVPNPLMGVPGAQYRPGEGTIFVSPVSAELVHDVETFSKMDIYVVFVVNNER